MKYRVIFSNRANRDLEDLILPVREKIAMAAQSLADNPRPHGCIKLKGSDEYRIRVGDYRVVYEIHDRVITVNVVAVGHRKDIYR